MIDKIKLLQKAYPDYEINAIATKKFNGIWFLIDGFEAVALSNEEACFADNNIVTGFMADAFEEIEQFSQITVYYP